MNEEMELKSFLLEALKERFKADTTLRAIEKRIESIAEKKTFEKYKDVTLFNDGMEFELTYVKASIFSYSSSIIIEKINLSLAFFCKSKLPKIKREKLEELKAKYEKHKHIFDHGYKKPIAKQLQYSIELDKVISGEINLRIE
jgi:hypothetical protein